ncbi:MAG: hypothetical protein R6X02_19635 [Enhygromyxa sp.]
MPIRPMIASFAGSEPVRQVLGQLHAAGVERDDIALLMTQEQQGSRFGLVPGHKLGEGVALGAALGAVLGGLVGGVLALGGLSPIGITIAVLAGLGCGGGIGSVIGAVAGLGAPNYRAKLGEASASGDQVLLAVWPGDEARAQRVAQILASS